VEGRGASDPGRQETSQVAKKVRTTTIPMQ